MQKLRILSFDPGTSNFAYSIQEYSYDGSKLKAKILGTGMFTKCVTQLTGNHMNKQIRKFQKAMLKIKRKYNPDRVFIERFQSRGLTGTTIECINIMLGLMLNIFADKQPNIYLASTWKNRINKKLEGLFENPTSKKASQLDLTYKAYGMSKVASPKTPHELDATLIGFYSATRILGMQDFENFNTNNWEKFISWFLTTPKL